MEAGERLLHSEEVGLGVRSSEKHVYLLTNRRLLLRRLTPIPRGGIQLNESWECAERHISSVDMRRDRQGRAKRLWVGVKRIEVKSMERWYRLLLRYRGGAVRLVEASEAGNAMRHTPTQIEVDSDETVLWHATAGPDSPRPKGQSTWQGWVFGIAIGVLWVAFMATLIAAGVGSLIWDAGWSAGDVLRVIGGAAGLMLAGWIAVVVVPNAARPRPPRPEVYLLTDRRLVVRRHAPEPRENKASLETTYFLDVMAWARVVPRDDGRGDVMLAAGAVLSGVEDPHGVRRLIEGARAKLIANRPVQASESDSRGELLL
jgi:hypothetical protein